MVADFMTRPKMTSITQLLSPMPMPNTKHSVVLRDHMEPSSHPAPSYTSVDGMQPNAPSSTDHYGAEHAAHHGDNAGDSSSDARKGYGKRELSMSKRAAQNRAAQRAFRQRKEGYIKKLEEQVRDYQALSENYKALQQENYSLRDYIINLQSRLIESQGEVPPPPSNLDGLHPEQGTKSRQPQPHAQPPPIPQPHATSPLQSTAPATLPRLSELSALPQHAPKQSPERAFYDQVAKHSQVPGKDMTPAQAALQGPSILQGLGGR